MVNNTEPVYKSNWCTRRPLIFWVKNPTFKITMFKMTPKIAFVRDLKKHKSQQDQSKTNK